MTKKALIVAIDAYPSPYTLRSCLNDAADLKTTLQTRGFTTITQISDAAATKSNIITALNALITGAVSGDSVVFAFFGHGSYIAGPEPDGRTEVICPVDYLNYIKDDELAAIISKLKAGIVCDVILGNCYSGTGTRAVAGLTNADRHMTPYCIPGPLPALHEKKEHHKDSVDDKIPAKAVVPVAGMNHVLWAACKDNQTAYEVLSGGKYRGLFPLYLCWALRNWPAYTRSQIDAEVAPRVTKVVPGQIPQTEGSAANLAALPFVKG